MPDSAWQTMRPSRNRAWGHPKLIKLLKRLGTEAKKEDGWPGLLVGDIAQPRGGPLVSGHASHQVGLDADIWLNPMPDHVLTYREREDISAKSMLDKTKLAVDPKVFTDKQVALIKRAASYPEVQRIFVHPAIKKALCERAGKDRAWLSKVRPLWGHHYHFHIRIYCPNGGCKAQAPVGGGDGCGKEVDNWLKEIAKSLKRPEPKPGEKVVPPSALRMIRMDQATRRVPHRAQRASGDRGRRRAESIDDREEVALPPPSGGGNACRHRAGHARSPEAAISMRDLRQILLVIILGEIELGRG